MSETVNKFSFQWKKDSINCLYLTEINTAKKALNILSSCVTLGIDTETYATTDTEKGALDPHNGSIRLIQIGSTKNVCVFDVVKIQKTTSEDLSLIFKDFLSQNIQFIAHNALFDLKFLTNWISPDKYIIPFNFRCSYILYKLVHHIRSALDTTASNASLANVVKSLLGVNLAKGCQASDWGNEDLTHEQIEYAALDPVVTLQVYEKLYPYIKNYKLNNVYNLMCELQKPIAMAELRGIGFNKDAHKDLYKSWAIKLYESRENLVKLIGQDKVTPHSLAKYLENTLPQDLKERWPKTEKGKFQTDAHALADFDWLPEVKPIGLFAKYNKLVSSYGESFKQHINSKTSRIHCSFNIAGARTGRLSCMSPNMQQCPREAEFRNLFKASEGYTLVVADYSQIEVRVAAEISKDPEMLKVYREGLDIYVYTASKVFHKPMDKVSKHERTLCKSLVLGLLYGLGANGFVHYVKKGSGIDVPLTEAQELVEKFRETYSVYRSWQLKQAENAAESCMTATLLGKKRRLEADNTYGPSMNTPIQGTAGEIMSLALVNMYKKIVQESLKCYIILTVHDEMVLECVEEQADKVCIHLEEAMKDAYLTIFPEGITQGLVEATKGYTWSEAKK